MRMDEVLDCLHFTWDKSSFMAFWWDGLGHVNAWDGVYYEHLLSDDDV